jgi:DnaJ family protein C protein 19
VEIRVRKLGFRDCVWLVAIRFWMSEISSSRAMATPLIAGIAVAVTALAGKYGIEAWQAFKTRQAVPTVRKYYEGGFQAVMTRREAARILGVRESVAQDKVKEAHRRVMQANHPDAGGSDYLASKINEAKDHLLGQSRGSGSAF